MEEWQRRKKAAGTPGNVDLGRDLGNQTRQVELDKKIVDAAEGLNFKYKMDARNRQTKGLPPITKEQFAAERGIKLPASITVSPPAAGTAPTPASVTAPITVNGITYRPVPGKFSKGGKQVYVDPANQLVVPE